MTVLPGPSAVETALVASGLVGERYQFLGYLPRTENARAALWERARRAGRTRPSRSSRRAGCRRAFARSPTALPERPVAVCRELTKRFEEVAARDRRGVAERFPEPPRGEITLVVGPGELERAAEADALAAVVASSSRPASAGGPPPTSSRA